MKHPDIIEKIKKEAKNGGKEFGAANALVEFSVLLGMLAEEADATADKNLKISEATLLVSKDNLAAQNVVIDLTRKLHFLTRWLTGLTVVLGFLTVIQAWPGIAGIYNFLKGLCH